MEEEQQQQQQEESRILEVGIIVEISANLYPLFVLFKTLRTPKTYCALAVGGWGGVKKQ